VLADKGLRAFEFTDDMRRRVTRLDLSQNFLKISSIDAPSLSYSWLRELILSNNNLTRAPVFGRPTCLLRLDLSGNPELTVIPAGFSEAVPQLRELNLQNCALRTLGPIKSPLSPAAASSGLDGDSQARRASELIGLRFLEVLNVENNALSLHELTPILHLKTLKQLWWRRNPGLDDPLFGEEIGTSLREHLPNVIQVDGRNPRVSQSVKRRSRCRAGSSSESKAGAVESKMQSTLLTAKRAVGKRHHESKIRSGQSPAQSPN